MSRRIVCRLLPHALADGPRNMATDEVLLDAVAADPGSAVLRTYEWSTPTLSLGYFQAIAEAEADPRWGSVAVVRRPTGGGALWHDREVTYAVILPANHPSASRGVNLYAIVHETIAGVLRGRGVKLDRWGDRGAESPSTTKPFLCFADRTDEDLLSGPAKVVGSAQRRRAGAVLQHGSVLLRTSPTTPELLGLGDLGAPELDSGTLAAELLGALAGALELEARSSTLSDREVTEADRLAREVYERAGWTRKR